MHLNTNKTGNNSIRALFMFDLDVRQMEMCRTMCVDYTVRFELRFLWRFK
jgi:hypothetical protein